MSNIEEDPLQAALANAFAESPIITKGHAPAPSAPAAESESAETPAAASEAVETSDGSWKQELDRLSESWREESARAREKAERERERWRVIREQEAEERLRASTESTNTESGWESVATSSKMAEQLKARVQAVTRHDSPSPADARDLTTGEHQPLTESELQSLLPHPDDTRPGTTQQQHDTPYASVPPSNPDDNGSRTWEDLPSLDSSFPSFSLNDPSSAGSEPHRERPKYPEQEPPPSVTLAIFDTSLSRRARVFALFSSITINLFLPFINGVMLGFGEIFAKNVIGYFGWQLPGAGVGIRTGSGQRSR